MTELQQLAEAKPKLANRFNAKQQQNNKGKVKHANTTGI